ncbi:MAG: bifunctional folylpolyglutamate synthase/dihydrofolate synthase [Candidatus Omnitrophica bacterium]|nr:bifunctional folylpolyglutamate synthase/dihydrofolate synthase [Candidatus Omnitrophota bacterium]
MITNYCQARGYLEDFINYEKTTKFNYKNSFKLERVRFLFKQLKIPYQDLKAIHIAGTKGKGSTAKICAQSLIACGFKVGLYTSPHLFDFRERIRVNRRMISKEDLVRIVEGLRSKIEKGKLSPKLGQLSFFEIYTAIAFKYFLEKKVDYAVIETGLGGRLDATNIVKPKVSVITHIGYDHTDLLGRRLYQIAKEKAGIIKTGVPVVCAKQQPSVLKIIKQIAKVKKAPLFLLGRDFKVNKLRLKAAATVFDYVDRNNNKLNNLSLPFLGSYQADNAACALCAYFLLNNNKLQVNKLNRYFDRLNLEGRFELISQKPLVLVDVAHNPSSFSALSDNLKLYYRSKKVILIFGCLKDKAAKVMLEKIPYQKLILTSFKNPRVADPIKLKKYAKGESIVTSNLRQALVIARQLYKENFLILISGSLFLVAQAKRVVKTSGFFGNFS